MNTIDGASLPKMSPEIRSCLRDWHVAIRPSSNPTDASCGMNLICGDPYFAADVRRQMAAKYGEQVTSDAEKYREFCRQVRG